MTPGERLKRRLERRKANKRRRPVQADQWHLNPRSEPEPEPRGPVTYPLVAPRWYEFCVRRFEEYESRGMKTASQMYWAMRFWDKPHDDPNELTTEVGFEEHMASYWEYKLETVPHMFDYSPPSG